jgi:general secretion pathway protein G
MLTRRSGFTLIELLIVMTIIGLLAAIALPKFGRTRERAHFKAMASDLRQLITQQESYWSNPNNNYLYAPDLTSLPDYKTSSGVTVGIANATAQGWSATATHAALASTQTCAIYMGTVATVPAPASTPGLVTCTNE